MRLIISKKCQDMVRELLDYDNDPLPDVFLCGCDYDELLAACKLVEKSIKLKKPIVAFWTDYSGFWFLGTAKEVEARLKKQLDVARAEQRENEAVEKDRQAERAMEQVKLLKRKLKKQEAIAAKAKPKKTKSSKGKKH